MNCKIPMPELAKREKNFYSSNPVETPEQISFYTDLQEFTKQIEVDIDKLRGLNMEQILRMIVSRIYYFLIDYNADDLYNIFDHNTCICNDVLDASFFTTLCMFLHDTKRLKGISLQEFIYRHSPEGYSIRGSRNYFQWDEDKKETDGSKYSQLLDGEVRLRQFRKRLYASKKVHKKNTAKAAIRKVQHMNGSCISLQQIHTRKIKIRNCMIPQGKFEHYIRNFLTTYKNLPAI